MYSFTSCAVTGPGPNIIFLWTSFKKLASVIKFAVSAISLESVSFINDSMLSTILAVHSYFSESFSTFSLISFICSLSVILKSNVK